MAIFLRNTSQVRFYSMRLLKSFFLKRLKVRKATLDHIVKPKSRFFYTFEFYYNSVQLIYIVLWHHRFLRFCTIKCFYKVSVFEKKAAYGQGYFLSLLFDIFITKFNNCQSYEGRIATNLSPKSTFFAIIFRLHAIVTLFLSKKQNLGPSAGYYQYLSQNIKIRYFRKKIIVKI